MIIEYNIEKYLISDLSTLTDAIACLTKSRERIVFCVNSSRKLSGVLTNGDLLRWLASPEEKNFSQSVSLVMNKKFHSVFESDLSKVAQIETLIKKFSYVPVLDQNHHVLGIARKRREDEVIHIGQATISQNSPVYIIAEIGNNHNGDVALARRLVDLAKKSGADCVKFQLRDMETLYHNFGQADDAENLGTQYTLDLLNRFQLKTDALFTIFDYCKSIGVQPLCTPWDEASLQKLEAYGMPAYKVASADLTNHDFLKILARTGKPLICSTGMADSDEIKQAVDVLTSAGAQFILLHCNSTYPAPYADINLNYMARLAPLSSGIVGYSGHERGIEIPIAAVALGAKVIEKHFTIDKEMEGNDHKVSLLPEEFAQMVAAIRNTEKSLGSSDVRKLSQGELMNRVNLAKSLVINCNINQGQIIEAGMIEVKSPGKGLQPNKKQEVLGKPAKRNMKAGDFFYPSDISTDIVSARKFKFPIPWGVPVRYHDFNTILDLCPAIDFVEFHLSYKDLEIDLGKYLKNTYKIGFVVHSPELFAGDHIMDLCSDNDAYRKHSIAEMQRVVDVTRKLKSYFPKTTTPLIVANVGGFTQSAPLAKQSRKKLYEKVLESLRLVDSDGVEIIPQTMPPFPWHMGGQQFHNLFVDPDEIAEFCNQYKMRICFDVSHSGLACNHNHYSFHDFVRSVLPYTAHLHIADALGQDGEGLQIHEGDLDFKMLFDEIREKGAKCSFLPEIWQGHENNGEGFWLALNRLEQLISR